MENLVLVLNCGSSSIKFAILNVKNGHSQLTGLAEKLGNHDARLVYKQSEQKHTQSLPANASHQDALKAIEALVSDSGLEQYLVAVGHRVVHGGETFTQSAVVTDEVKKAIENTSHMAPLHNPANLAGIVSAQKAFSQLPHVAVFDTAFFQSMPKHAFLYALPYELYEQHGIRRYGFHGSSHTFVTQEASVLLNKPLSECNLISAHLGNGCSVAAIKQGKAVDTSLGFTPLEGLIMGTRSGDIDPSLPGFITQQLGYSTEDVDKLLNKQSGLLGISKLSNDCRALEEAAEQGNELAALALQMFSYRLAKYIGSYMAVTGPLDALIFTGGIGENSDFVRASVIKWIEHLGFKIDPQLNAKMRFGQCGSIQQNGISQLVIPTNEEWVIARDAVRLCGIEE